MIAAWQAVLLIGSMLDTWLLRPPEASLAKAVDS